MQSGRQAALTIPFADTPNRGRILLDLLAQEDDSLPFIVSVQQDLCTTGDLQRCLAVPQQFAQEDFISRFQDKLVRFATAHGSSPPGGSD